VQRAHGSAPSRRAGTLLALLWLHHHVHLRGAMIALVFILFPGPAAKLPGFTLFKPVSR